MSEIDEIKEQYVELGKRWLSGEVVIDSWGFGENVIKFNEKQVEFINSKERYVLFSGGIASGKTKAFVTKLALLCLFFPNNRILLGRKTRANLEATTVRDFFDVVPEGLVEYQMGKGIIKFFNGSEILLKGLDALQEGSQQEIKKAEQEIKSLNLGGVFIDQLEEIEERVFRALGDRLRRDVGFRQMNFTTNPANFWAYDYWKANPRENTKLIETSLFDNKANLPEDFIKDRLNNPENYVKRYVYGVWDTSVLSEGTVFEEQFIRDQSNLSQQPLREFDGIKIFREPEEEEYQIGIDPSQGVVDPCSIKVISKSKGDEVASFSGFIPVEAIGEKTLKLAYMYGRKALPLIIPEVNATGAALIEWLKTRYAHIYEREVFNYRDKKKMKKLGWNTSQQSKMTLIENFRELMRRKFVVLRDKPTIEEMKTFVWSDEARRKGAGAQDNFHDDKVMATMLAYWGVEALTPREKEVFEKESQQEFKLYEQNFS